MLEMLTDWELDVERGPNWLFVRLRGPAPHGQSVPRLADRLWLLLQEHLVDRLVVELDEIQVPSMPLLEELTLLHERINSHGGMMRLCGVSPSNQGLLRSSCRGRRFSCYRDREEAVLGECGPRHPR
jgi:hypothetical protein